MKAIAAASGLAIMSVAMVDAQTAGVLLSVSSQRALVNQYCAGCHNDKLQSGGFSWTQVDLAHPGQTAEQLEKVIRKVRVGMMPPPGMPRPAAATRKALAQSLEAGSAQAAAAPPNPGRPPLHRLNRTKPGSTRLPP